MPASLIQRQHLLKSGFNTRFQRNRIKSICKYCKKEYERIPSKIGKYCSYSCSSLALTKYRIYKIKSSPNYKSKTINLICKQCGKHFTDFLNRTDGRIWKNGNKGNRKYCSNKCRQLASRKPDGLKTDKTLLSQWKILIFKRDNYTCLGCGCKRKRLLHAHHIVARSQNQELWYEIDNGQTLCIYCHIKKHPELKEMLLKSAHIKLQEAQYE